MTEDERIIETGAAKFMKNALLSSEKYRRSRDMLRVILEDDKRYTHQEVEDLITTFKKEKVN